MARALAVLLLLATGATTAAPQDTAHARALWLDALDREAVLDLDSGLALLRAARDADPWFHPAQRRLLLRLQERGATSDRRGTTASVATHPEDPGLACYDALRGAPYGYPQAAVDSLLALTERHGPTLCSSLGLATLARRLLPARTWIETGLTQAREATRQAPQLAQAWDEYAQLLSLAGHGDDAERAMRTALARSQHPMTRVVRYVRLAALRLERGDTAGARALRQSVAAAVQRDGRPGLRVVYLHGIAGLVASQTEWEAAAREEADIARRHAAWPWELRALWTLCAGLDNRGNPAAAVACDDRAVAIADQAGSSPLRVRSHVLRGRALSHAGQLTRAAADLRAAIAATTSAEAPTLLAEAWHNLAHLHEAEGHIEDAARSALRFAKFSASLPHWTARMTSFRDLGMIRWKAGWHAAAKDAFDRMVQVIDAQELNYHYAGEYFERTGDLQQALRYYRLAVGERSSLSATWAALTRVYEALGQVDSARASGRRHDRRSDWGPLEVPLLPDILADDGEFAEAVGILEDWAARQSARRNIRGSAVAYTHLGELYLRWGRAGPALVQATHAESLAAGHNLLEQVIDARRVIGMARIRLGDRESGLRLLQRAASMAGSHPTADLVLSTNMALGRTLAGAGRRDEALAAYATAATAVEEMSASLDADLDRARYRSRNLAPFDGAAHLLLAATPIDPERLLQWSQRRKSAALVRSVLRAWSTDVDAIPRPALRDLRNGITRRTAVIDYLVLDTIVAATAVTHDVARSVVLPLTAQRLTELVRRLRAPMVASRGGYVDLAHARFDTASAHALYLALIAPLLPVVAGTERLVVVPDGAIHALPVDALISAPGVMVADRWEVVELPSLRFLGRIAPAVRPMDADGRILVLAQDAPGTAAEVAAIENAWGARRVDARTGPAATETRARREATRYAVVHFATHAVADALDPLASHIRLAADSANDGYLHADEIEASSAHVALAVLSACETSSGQSFPGEGLMSLARAFLAGGAQGVVATLWPVGAASADLMGAFHARLAEGMSPGAALRSAKLELRRNPATAHPFFWAGFVYVSGNGGRR